MGLFHEAASNIADVPDAADLVTSPADAAPLRGAVQELFEDWLQREISHYWEYGGGQKYFNASDVWRAAKARAESLGLEWRHEADLVEQSAIDAEE